MYWYITLLMYQSNSVRNAYLDSKLNLVNMGLQASSTIEGGDPLSIYPGYDNVQLYKTMIEDALHNSSRVISVLDGSFQLPSKLDIFKYALGETGMSSYVDPLYDVFVAGADPVGVAAGYFIPSIQFPSATSILTNYLKVHEQSMEGIRALIFNNDDNDGVVRVKVRVEN
ncbi:MAG: hypothetical protein IPP15_08015 [Saprospiraceae bacterium]|uniref:Uncharacterized protein n=1 Tax=Candidatus Opimibacter skivensis TaxID=2982028 RepID=A0A9D7SVA8_9BACT|nr:hypothetical protein [Candidatus Opimibacter skivensis]